MLLASPSSMIKVVQPVDVEIDPGAEVGVGDGDGVGVGVGVHPTRGVKRIKANPSVISNIFLFIMTSFMLEKTLFFSPHSRRYD
jgi:hypothetical protein